MTFYLDIILIENMIMNYIILFATGVIIGIKTKTMRLLLASLLGSAYVIVLYIIPTSIYINHITKLMLSISMVYIGFMPKNFKKFVKIILIFYLTSFCFGGTAYYLLYNISPKRINNINGILIGSYPIIMAILGGMIGFVLVYISFRIIKGRFNKNSIYYNVEIAINDKTCVVRTILDTGNFLVEPTTLFPVIIVEEKSIQELISEEIIKKISDSLFGNNIEEIPEEIRTRCKFIPFSSIGKRNGMIIGIKPDYIKIFEEEYETIKHNVIIGIIDYELSKNGEYVGLIGLECLKNKIKEQEEVCR